MIVKEKIKQKSDIEKENKITPAYQKFLDETSEQQKSEWINSELVVHSPVAKRHLSLSRKLTRLMSSHADRYDLGYVAFEKALINLEVGVQNYEPDIVFFAKGKTKKMTETTSMFGIPDFVVEILSNGTAKRDRGVKFINYEKFGVSEYWIADAEHKTVEQFILQNKNYRLIKKYKIGDYIESKMLNNFFIPVRALFDTYINLAELDKPIRQIFEAKIQEKDKKIQEKNKKIQEKDKEIQEKELQLVLSIKFMKKMGATIKQIVEATKQSEKFIKNC